MDELPELRAFSHQQDCQFIVNRAIPVGGMKAENVPSPVDLKSFLDQEPGITSSSVPFSGNTPCNRLEAGCYIGSDALVRPCPSIEEIAGNLRKQSIATIWNDSQLLQKTRNITQFAFKSKEIIRKSFGVDF